MPKLLLFIFAFIVFLSASSTRAQTSQELFKAWDKYHLVKTFASDMRHHDLKKYLDELKKNNIKVAEVGRSFENREIYQIEWGKGAIRVFMWSQMHGDEPTATPALLDMFVFLNKNRELAWVKRMEENLTIRAVPMLNPDGAELFRRRSLQGIDINRDARNLKTPEAQLLKRLRDEWNPQIGFNLHNQQELTTVEGTSNQAAISFLVVEGDPTLSNKEGNERNKRLVSAMVIALQDFIRGHVGRYVDSYNPDAFGDKFSDWGTNTILIETGALHGKDEHFLVKMNFIAFLTALNALADGNAEKISPINYELLPKNSSGNLFNFIFRRAHIVNPGDELIIPMIADITVNTSRGRASMPRLSVVQGIVNFSSSRGLEEYDVRNFYLVPRFPPLNIGSLSEFFFYRKDRQIDWKAENLEQKFPPDAIFSQGKWLKPLPR